MGRESLTTSNSSKLLIVQKGSPSKMWSKGLEAPSSPKSMCLCCRFDQTAPLKVPFYPRQCSQAASLERQKCRQDTRGRGCGRPGQPLRLGRAVPGARSSKTPVSPGTSIPLLSWAELLSLASSLRIAQQTLCLHKAATRRNWSKKQVQIHKLGLWISKMGCGDHVKLQVFSSAIYKNHPDAPYEVFSFPHQHPMSMPSGERSKSARAKIMRLYNRAFTLTFTS